MASLSTVKPSTDRGTTFLQSYTEDYCVIPLFDTETKRVIAAECQFCVYYSRETSIPLELRKRKQTANIKQWKPGQFRLEAFRNHHESQHESRWRTYQSLPIADKRTFFENKVKFKHTLHHTLGGGEPSLTFEIDATIFEDIIGDMFFHPDNHGQLTQE